MDRYTKYQIVASLCVALFVISLAMCILAHNKNIYNDCYEEYYIEVTEDKEGLDNNIKSPAEMYLYFEQLSDSFTDFFQKSYDISGYELTKGNIKNLNNLKAVYKWSVVLVILSFLAGCYSIWFISKRRLYMPLVYGGILAALFTSVNAFILITSDHHIIRSVRNMVLKKDYGYFAEGDILTGMFPPEYAGRLAVMYLILVLILVIVMVLIRQLIVFLGRPHKF